MSSKRFICPECSHMQMETDPFRSDNNKVSDKTINDIFNMLKRYNVAFKQVGEYFHLTTRAIIKYSISTVRLKEISLLV